MCDDCPHYDPMGVRILIIKLAATGDVLRTTPILAALKRLHPQSHITWVTRPRALELLEGLDEIDRALPLDVDTLARLPAERFDLVVCLDKEPAATGLATQVDAADTRGFVLGPHGNPLPANENAAYAYRLGLDDDLKFHGSRMTYQQVVFGAVGLPWSREEYRLELPARARTRANELFAALDLDPAARLVGLNVGAGEAFAYKAWRVKGWAELAELAEERLGARVCLLGGPRDRERVEAVAALCSERVLDPGATPSILEFAALLEHCDAVVSGDTLGLHLALALRRPVVAVFGSTAPQELDLYGRGQKIVPAIGCHPCYKRSCDLPRTCADVVTTQEVFEALSRVIESPR